MKYARFILMILLYEYLYDAIPMKETFLTDAKNVNDKYY